MGVCGTFYRVDNEGFNWVKLNKKVPWEIKKEMVSLDKLYDSFSYILVGKHGTRDNVLSEIVYPKESIAFHIDEKYGYTDGILYSTPEKVIRIHQLLKQIEIKQFKKLYEASDLKDCQHILEKNEILYQSLEDRFIAVKNIFKNAALEQDFILTYIG